MKNKLLQGKVSIITGSANGIGKATALKFGEEGAIVIVCDLNGETVQAVVDEIIAAGGQAKGYVVDVTKSETIALMVEDVKKVYGRIDVLINNAGITKDATLRKMTEAQFDTVIAVNLKGTFLCTKAVIETMITQGSGVIINTSSIVGLGGNVGQTNYGATKWASLGMMKTWAKELGPKGIRCMAVCPGFTLTDMVKAMPEEVLSKIAADIPSRRLGAPEEIANVYVFLASDLAAYMNGAVLTASGGLTL